MKGITRKHNGDEPGPELTPKERRLASMRELMHERWVMQEAKERSITVAEVERRRREGIYVPRDAEVKPHGPGS